MREFIETIILAAISAVVAWFVVNAFDAWYVDKEERRARKRSRRHHPSNSSGPRYE